MIPLGNWLLKDEGYAQDLANSGDGEGLVLCNAVEISPQTEAVVDGSGAGEMKNEILHLRDELHELQRKAAAREQQLMEQLGGEVVSKIMLELRSGFTCIQSGIEEAVYEVLVSFLGEVLGRKATDELLMLLRQSMAETREPLLEVKAPSHVLLRLDEIMTEQPNICFTESDEISLNFEAGAARFEELASHWANVLRGSI